MNTDARRRRSGIVALRVLATVARRARLFRRGKRLADQWNALHRNLGRALYYWPLVLPSKEARTTSEYCDDRPREPNWRCHEAGCDRSGLPCSRPDLDGTKAYGQPDVYYCQTHIADTGFCPGCGNFHGGEESFDFDPHNLR